MDSRKAPFLAPFPSRLIALAAILGFGGLVACTSEQVAEVIATGTITVSVSVEGTGAGRITVDISQLAGLACRYMAGDPSVLQGSTCNESFDDGGNAGSFTLTATPDAGMVFDRWTSGCSAATSTSCTVSFPGGTNQSVSIRAKFDDPNYVPLNVSPTEVLIREFGAVGAVSVTAAGGLVGGTPSWSSSAQSIATVSAASGSYEATITGVSPGTANVTVSAAGETATVAVTVEPPPMVLVEPGDVVMTTLGDSFTGMTARAFDDAGNPVAGAMFDWSSSAPGIVEVFATAGDGSTATVRAVGAGTATISATTTTGGSGGVDVTVKPVTQLDVQPPAATISEFGPGGALGLTATAMDAGGNEVVEAEIEWSSSDPAIATVTTNGATSAVDGLAAGARVSNATVEGVADGVVTITAKVVTRDVEAQGAEGTSTVTVQVVNTVEVTPTSSTITELGVAGVVELTAIARDALGGEIPNLAYEWSSSDDAIGSVNATGDGSTADVTGNAAGMVTITATTDDVSGTSDITVDPGPPGLIVFTTEFVGNDEIHSINPDGTEFTRLTFNTVKDDEPSLSGDGTKIGFRSERQGNNANIFIMNVDGSSPLQLTFSGAHDDEPSVSPDGTRIVFYSDRASGTDSEVYVVATDGVGAPVQLTNNSAADDDPDWSPDGTQIVFRSDRDGQDEIYIMNDDGTGQTRLTFNGASDNKPSWSPLGDRIVFETNRNGVDDIYTMKTDGTDLVRVTDQSGDDEEPAWSPDARWIVFLSDRDHASNEVYIMRADGFGSHQADEQHGGGRRSGLGRITPALIGLPHRPDPVF